MTEVPSGWQETYASYLKFFFWGRGGKKTKGNRITNIHVEKSCRTEVVVVMWWKFW